MGSVPVRFRTTPVTPDPGAATATSMTWPWPTLPQGPMRLSARVSSTRCGACGVIRLPPADGVCAEPNHPTTSATTWGVPAFTLTFTEPSAPTRAMTRLGTV